MVSSNSPKKRTNKFVIVVKKKLFIPFLGEFEDTKGPFEIIWPLAMSHKSLHYFKPLKMLSETWKSVIIYWKHYNLIYFTPPTTLVSFSNTAGWFSWDLIKLTPFGLSFGLQFFLGAILRSNNGTPQIIAKIALLCKSIFQRSYFLMSPLKSRIESQYLFYVLKIWSIFKCNELASPF